MTTPFHGVRVMPSTDALLPLQVGRTGVIGIVGTAPNAGAAPNAITFPLNKPTLITGSRVQAAALGDEGTLPQAVNTLLKISGALIVVVRVAEGESYAETVSNVLGGYDALSGQYEGVHALVAAETETGYRPKILLAPSFTHNRRAGGVLSVTVTAGGSGYTTAPTVAIAGAGTGAAATAVLGSGDDEGKVVAVNITNAGSDYTTATISFSGGSGTGATATATIGDVPDVVATELESIAERLRAVAYIDAPDASPEIAIAYRKDFGSRRLRAFYSKVLIGMNGDAPIYEWPSVIWAGVRARTDDDPAMGFWYSASNKAVAAALGTKVITEFLDGDANCRAQLLNEQGVNVLIRRNGWRTWGNDTCSDDPRWRLETNVRIADAINETLEREMLVEVDAPITRAWIDGVVASVNAFINTLKTKGAIAGGSCWIDPAKNPKEQVAAGVVRFSFDFTPTPVAESIEFDSIMTDRYITEII